MSRPVIATKLYAPTARAGLVTRARLRQAVRLGAATRLTLVSAPAGFGKTTLLTEWLHDRQHADDRRVAWLSLDASDADPASFWTYVVTALQTAVPGTAPEAMDLVASSPLPTEQLLTTLVNDLATTQGQVWLVLDDYHLADGPELSAGMVFLLDHLPPQVHIVISTRADPGLPLSRWRARREMVEVRAADLRFTVGEATEYLNEAVGLDLTTDELSVLEQRTEGWIAALQLAALSMRGREDVGVFISRFAGNDRYIVDYLVEEVLAHQPDQVREFLLHSAVLSSMTGPLCDAITGRDDGNRMLLALERGNLFVVPLDDRREFYRYHHLFADVLRARLLNEQPETVPMLHRRASVWYEQQNMTGDAVRHALAASDADRAAHLMELAVPQIRRDRQDAVLIGWLKELPDEALRRSPVLSVFYGWMLLVSGDLDDVEPRLADAERALAAVPEGSAPRGADSVELRRLPATIAVYRASLAQARGDVVGTAEHARRALELSGPDDHLARGAGNGFLGLAAWAQGDVRTALHTFTDAVASLHAAGNLSDELGGTVVLADMWLTAGYPGTARRLYTRALTRLEALGEGRDGEPGHSVLRGTTDLRVGVGELDHEAGDLDGARRHLETAAGLGDRAGITENRHRWFLAMARVADAAGDTNGALRHLDHAEQRYVPGFYPDVRPVAALRARVWIARGQLAEANDWARERGLAPTDEVSYLREFEHLTLVRLLLAQRRDPGSGSAPSDPGALHQVTALLERLLAVAEASGRHGSAAEIRMLHALTHDALGERQRARQLLSQALAGPPEPDGYARLFLDEGPAALELLADLAEVAEPSPARDRARRLLDLASSTGVEVIEATDVEAEGRSARAPAEMLTERELAVMRLLDTELSGPDIASELFISLNTLRSHTKNIFTKLDVTSRRAAVGRARESGLL